MRVQQKVRADFLKEHPNYKITSVGAPDGNDTTFVTVHVRYKKPDDEREYWSDWSYDTKDGKFVFAAKGNENLSSGKAQQ
jgi:predicted SnoaL-like aldol condensation-catalyzing enzyme